VLIRNYYPQEFVQNRGNFFTADFADGRRFFSDFYLCNLRNLRSIPFGCGSAALYYYPQEFVQTRKFLPRFRRWREFFSGFYLCNRVSAVNSLVAGRPAPCPSVVKALSFGSAALGPFRGSLFPFSGSMFSRRKVRSLTYSAATPQCQQHQDSEACAVSPGLSETPAGCFRVYTAGRTRCTRRPPKVPARAQTWHRQPSQYGRCGGSPSQRRAPAMDPVMPPIPRLAAPLAPAAAPPVPELHTQFIACFSRLSKRFSGPLCSRSLLKLILAKWRTRFPAPSFKRPC